MKTKFQMQSLHMLSLGLTLCSLALGYTPEITSWPEHILARAKTNATELFANTSPFSDLGAFKDEVQRNGSAQTRLVLREVMANHFEITLQRSPEIRSKIVANGFLNQFQTNTSGGILNPKRRQLVEATYLNMTESDYATVPFAVRPKYGALQPAPGIGIERSEGADRYGSDIYIFDSNRVANRTTLFITDSLDYYTVSYRDIRTGKTSETYHPPEDWTHVYLPLEYSPLIAPYWRKSKEYDRDYSMFELIGRRAPLLRQQGLIVDTLFVFADYIELQIWGPLTMEDVKTFEFYGEPPSGNFLKELQRRHIPIRDGKRNRTEWRAP